MEYDYKVIDLGSSSGALRSNMAYGVESKMNKMSQQGWEYINSITPAVNSKYFDEMGNIFLVFRRKK